MAHSMPGAGVVHHITSVALCNTWLSAEAEMPPAYRFIVGGFK
jgi:hypothetical protein